jgi:hypothetical protein
MRITSYKMFIKNSGKIIEPEFEMSKVEYENYGWKRFIKL